MSKQSKTPNRQGWEEAFAEAVKAGDAEAEQPLPDYMSEAWDQAEWTW